MPEHSICLKPPAAAARRSGAGAGGQRTRDAGTPKTRLPYHPNAATLLNELVNSEVSQVSDRFCLIVDDEPAIRTYIRAILEGERLKSLEAENAGHALRILQKLGSRLDFVISDINMPGDMNGIDLAHSIRNTFPALPVILISGYGENMEQGGFAFIPKPFSVQTILNAVKRAMEVHSPEASAAASG